MLVMSSMMFLHLLLCIGMFGTSRTDFPVLNSLGKPDYKLTLTFGL